jgi:tetratricopeptide (TPR) repeat protein
MKSADQTLQKNIFSNFLFRFKIGLQEISSLKHLEETTMIDWAILATASALASSILGTAQDGVISNQSDRTVLKIVGKISDKLKTQTPADNHELAKAFRRACLVAAQHICDSRKTNISGQSSLAPQHNIASRLLGSTPTGLFAEDEIQWLEKANQYLNNQIEELNQDRVFLPERNDLDYESLINPKVLNKKVWANQLKRQMTVDMIAELYEAVGASSRTIFKELEDRWFLQACNEFQKALSHNQILANKFQNNLLVKLDSGQEITIELLLQMFQFMRESVNFQSKDLPKFVGRLTEKSLFVDREVEQKNLIEWLTQKSKKVIVVKAASGFGKTSLAMEVLHALAPDQKNLDERLDALLVFLCREGEGDFREVCKKVDERLGAKQNYFVSRYDEFSRETQQSPDILPDDIIRDVVVELAKLGNVWLVFDNFETVLLHNQIKENHLRAFFEKALQTNGLHFLLTSQKVPEFETRADIEKVEIDDLPEEFALEFLQKEGANLKFDGIDCGLAETTAEDLQKLKDLHFAFVPMALVALVGYLKASYRKYGETMAKVVEDQQLFAKFREHDAKTGSMSLIEKQYLALTAEERLVLKAVSIFPNAVEFPVLLKILDEHLDEDTIDRVLTSSTLVRRIDPNFYELLPQANEVISKQSDKEDEKLTVQQLHANAAGHYFSVRQPIAECYSPEQFSPYFSMIDHCIKAVIYEAVVQIFNESVLRLIALGYMQEIVSKCSQVVGKLSEQSFEANNLVNLSLSLNNLGRLDDAVTEYDKAIAIYEKLVHEKGQFDLVSDLAGAYTNKGITLRLLGRLNDAIAEYDKAIAIREVLVHEKGRIDLVNYLAGGYLNKGGALDGLGRLDDAIVEFDKAIEIYEKLVHEKGRIDLANDLAMAYMNKGTALKSLQRLNDADTEYDKAIAIREVLFHKKGRIDLASDLAMAYMNKGVTLALLNRLNDAIVEFDKAIEIYEKLVHEKGRIDLASDLATIYLNKGNALRLLDRFDEAVAECDKAIAILEALVQKGRVELAHYLVAAYMNNGIALEEISNLAKALISFDEGIIWREKCLSRGDQQDLPDYVKDLANRIRVLIKLEDWNRTANDVVLAFSFISLLENTEIPNYFKQRIVGEIFNIIQYLRETSPDDREEIYKHAGENGEVIRQYVDYSPHNQE